MAKTSSPHFKIQGIIKGFQTLSSPERSALQSVQEVPALTMEDAESYLVEGKGSLTMKIC